MTSRTVLRIYWRYNVTPVRNNFSDRIANTADVFFIYFQFNNPKRVPRNGAVVFVPFATIQKRSIYILLLAPMVP